MKPERPVVAALAVCVREASTILVQRRFPPDQGLWGYPGGKVERGETVAEAAVRELREETGVVAQALEALGPLDIVGRDERGAVTHHFVLIPVLCRWLSGEPQADADALDARWFDLAGLDRSGLAMSRDVVAVARKAVEIMD